MSMFALPSQIAGIAAGKFVALGGVALIVGGGIGFAYQPVMHRLIPPKADTTTVQSPTQTTAQAPLSWQTKDLAVSAYEGSETAQVAKINIATTSPAQVAVDVSSGLKGMVSVDVEHPSDIANNVATVTVMVVVPAIAADSYNGTVQLMYGGKPVGTPLTVAITTKRADCQTIPTDVIRPSPDRIGKLAGSPVVDDTVVVTLASSVTDKAARIRAIACKYGAQIVGSINDISYYELRIRGQKVDTLTPIIDKIAKESGVKLANHELLAQADGTGSSGPQ